MPVVDASVCVALFNIEEPGHEASRNWMEQVKRRGDPVIAPVILLAEVAAALSRGLGDAVLADEAVAVLQEKDFVRLFPVTDALALKAAGVASARRIRGCDAVYVALAYELGMQLVTWDGQQLERGQGLVEALRPMRLQSL